ncbi:sulfotransferase [Anderseniella sp. Alg231-50]|uniref:sulfotransferase n=1 Tax=Anderseniella sp. Alg231-50 TaxID=1922226 RepID=UPI000D550471
MSPSSPEKLWTEGRSLQAKGKLQRARKLLKQARAQAPRAPGLALELGVLEARMGMFKHALPTLKDAINLAPTSADAHYNLAEVLRATGQLDRAVGSYQEALRLDPGYTEAKFGLGGILLSQGDAEQALPQLEQAAQNLPQDAEAQTILAQALQELEQSQRALQILSSVVQTHPDYLAGHMAFLRALNSHAKPSQVARHIRSMEETLDMAEVLRSFDQDDPGSVSALQLLANCYQAAVMHERAKQIAEMLCRHKSSRYSGAILSGTLAIQTADFDAAETWFNKAIELQPDSADAMYRLSVINRLAMSAEPLLLGELNNTTTASASQRLFAGLALYRLLSRNGRPEDAFRALATAKAVSAQEYPYNAAMTERGNANNKQAFTPTFFAKRGNDGHTGKGCIFVVGMMRSGTTLTEQILAAHSKVYAGGERDDMMSIVESLMHDLTKVPDLPSGWAATIGKKLHEEMFRDAGSASFATDKLPGNIDYVGLIRFLLPEARFVYCHRTPQDCALSTFEQSFSSTVPCSSDLKAIAHKYALHEDIARYWTDTCNLDMFDLDYDAMVHDPEPHIRNLLEFCGLEFEESCLYPNEVKREIRTASVFQVRQPISPKSVGRWKVYEQQLEPFTHELARLRKTLGLQGT